VIVTTSIGDSISASGIVIVPIEHLLRFDELDIEYVDGYPVSVKGRIRTVVV